MSQEADGKPADAEVATPRPWQRFDARWTIFVGIGLVSLIADQASKLWARGALPVQGSGCSIPDDLITGRCRGVAQTVVDGYWDWRLSMNPGSAFGLFAGQAFARWLLTLVGIGAVVGMVVMLRRSRPDQRILHWALALVAGGAIGNLVDRVYFGVVTDFVLWHYHSHEWPVFNVADIVLVVGVGLMFIDIQKENNRDKRSKAAKKADAAAKAKAAGLVKDLSRRE